MAVAVEMGFELVAAGGAGVDEGGGDDDNAGDVNGELCDEPAWADWI